MQKIISFSLLVLSILSVYIILYVGLDKLWPIGYCSEAEKVNSIAINLSYSYIAGYIVYLLSVCLPQLYIKIKLKPVIKDKINSIPILFSNILSGFPSNEASPIIDIHDISHCKKIMEDADWNGANNLPIYSSNSNALYQTFFADYTALINFINQIISDYKSQLSTEQLLLLEKIRFPKFISYLDIFVKVRVKFPPNGQHFIVDEFVGLLNAVNKLELKNK